MHSYGHRINTVLTFFGTVAAGLCLLTAATDLFHSGKCPVQIGLHEVKRLVPHLLSKEQAVITFDVEANLSNAFSWNTKQLFVYLQAEYVTPENELNQIVLWDNVITGKDRASIKLKNHKTKYAFIEQGRNLRGRQFNLTLVWDVMPRVGYLYTRQHSVVAGTFPGSYKD